MIHPLPWVGFQNYCAKGFVLDVKAKLLSPLTAAEPHWQIPHFLSQCRRASVGPEPARMAL